MAINRRAIRSRPDADDAAMMRDRMTWPQWPYLPIKRYENDRLKVGIVYASKPLRVVYDVGLFDDLSRVQWQPVTVDQLLKDGWMVD